MTEIVHICESCREIVEPSDDNVIRAVRVKRSPSFTKPKGKKFDGLGVYFHRACAPTQSASYRLDDN